MKEIGRIISREKKMNRNWLFSRWADILVLFLPVWLVWGVFFYLPEDLISVDIPLWVWVVFIMGLDVGHVWSTIFRTYLKKNEFERNKKLFTTAPIVVFIAIFLVSSFSLDLFWRLMAYLAVFHFIKQQYGFLMLYKSKTGGVKRKKWIGDKFIIYFATLYPVLYWHLMPDRTFTWFVENDFLNVQTLINLDKTVLISIFNSLNIVYWLLILVWLFEELFFSLKENNNIAFGKVLWVLTTAGNWYIGIVYFNADLVFSVTNVVAHGIPYIALIIYYNEKKKSIETNTIANRITLPKWLKTAAIVLGVTTGIAFLEEYFWDMWFFRDRPEFFSSILSYPANILEDPVWQSLGIALLALPQVTHYVLDGFIWKYNDHNPFMKKIFSKKTLSDG